MKLLRLAALLGAFLMLVTQGAAEAQRHRRGFGGPGFLLTVPEVQRELRLTDAQVEQLKQLGQEMGAKAQESFRAVQNLSREERFRRFRAFDAEWHRRIADILSKSQNERLGQLNLQLQGQRALARKEVADELRLSADQRQRIEGILDGEREAFRQAFESIKTGGTMTQDQREEIGRKFREVRGQTDVRLNGTLTDSQRRQWQAMLGTPFKFPEFRKPRPQ